MMFWHYVFVSCAMIGALVVCGLMGCMTHWLYKRFMELIDSGDGG